LSGIRLNILFYLATGKKVTHNTIAPKRRKKQKLKKSKCNNLQNKITGEKS